MSAGGLSFRYDPAGNRVAMTNGAAVVKYVINPNSSLPQVLQRNNADNSRTYYIYGTGLLYEINENASGVETSTHYYHYDYRGSTIALSDLTGTVTDRVEYSAYGATTYRSGTTDTPFLYNGRYGVMTDSDGLLYMRARYYNPYICRFINADPSGFQGGLNFYAYADGNPISLIDPFGLYGNPVSGPDGPVGPSTAFAAGGVFYSPSPLPPPGPGAYLAGGAAVGLAGAAAVTFGAPLVVAGLVTIGVPVATATATTTLTIGVAGVFGGAATVYDIGQNVVAQNWDNVAFDIGTVGGSALFGGLGGGRFIADNASPAPSTVPPSWNPFTADSASTPTAPNGYGFVRNKALPLSKDLWNWLSSGPTPSSGGGSATGIAAGAGLVSQPPKEATSSGK